jgi:histidine triad (HIT) family protein
MEGCLFCSIVEGKMPSYKVFENPLFLVALDINPATKGHLIVIPKAHYRNIVEMPEQEMHRMFSLTRALSAVLIDYGAKGVNMLYSLGEAAGQRSPHMMVHLIPRYQDDKVHLVWEPQKLSEEDFRLIQSAVSAKINEQASQQQAPAPVQPQPMQPQQPQQPPQQPPMRWPRRTGGYY